MLPHQYRLPPHSIRDVMRCGHRKVQNGITIRYLTRKTFPNQEKIVSFRAAVVISAHVDKRAVIRNRMRRLIHESIMHLLPKMSTTIDFVIIGTKGFIGLSQSEMDIRIYDIFSNSPILHE